MSTAALLLELRSRGVTLRAFGNRLLYRPKDVVSPNLRELLVARKSELLAELQQVDTAEVAPTVRIRSPRYGDLWLAPSAEAAADLVHEFPDTPVVLYAEVPTLRGMSAEMIVTVLRVKSVFAGARLIR